MPSATAPCNCKKVLLNGNFCSATFKKSGHSEQLVHPASRKAFMSLSTSGFQNKSIKSCGSSVNPANREATDSASDDMTEASRPGSLKSCANTGSLSRKVSPSTEPVSYKYEAHDIYSLKRTYSSENRPFLIEGAMISAR